MDFIDFGYVAYSVIAIWGSAVLFSFIPKLSDKQLPFILGSLGFLIIAGYITKLWVDLERPPLRTLGETRLWYAGLLAMIGIFVFIRHRITWILNYSIIMGALFLIINLLNPEVLSKTLMPALQSPWFVPHVVVYIEAYALLATATLVSFRHLFWSRKDAAENLAIADNLVILGYGFLTMGLIFGALWAKVAWGHYWTWDPKETWALITWLCYLIYIHLRYHHKNNITLAFRTLALSFVILMVCWFGVNYIPAATLSVHTYTN